MTPECRTAGCTALPYVQGLCRACYRRLRGQRLGPCTVQHCRKPQHAQGLCIACYFLVWRARRRAA
ncbi:hypothetical protein GCM10010307_84490 [Streptomyces vastus]|uniref:Uncharacterized protein n=1 Tax=Streptomyces vastus TaxID=285451 RepID=A0ABN3RYC5_9ACTN